MDSISNKLDGSSLLLNQLQSNAAVKKAETKDSAGAGSALNNFGDLLKNQLSNINNLQGAADQAAQTYATGGDIELHNVIMAADKADMALQLALQIRNRMLTAYGEISRMGI